MSKKTLLAFIILIALVILAVGIYLLFFTMPKTSNVVDNNNYDPFGGYSGPSTSTPNTNNNATSTPDNTNYTNSATSPLVKISDVPISGAGTYERRVTAATSTTIVRYTERATGHTADFNSSTGLLSAASNTTIPSIYKAWWIGGSNLIAQFLDKDKTTIKTYTATLPTTSTSTKALSGSFLPNNIYNLSLSPKGSRVFYLQTGDSAIGTISNLDGSKRSQILDFPFSEWTSQWPNEGTITLTTKASAGVSGFMYTLSTVSGAMTKSIGDIPGLATRTNSSLTYVLYSTSQGNGIGTAIYDIAKKNSFVFDNVTLAEKCVWSTLNKYIAYCAVPTNIPNGVYPDDWYQGNVSFTDNIYKIDVSLASMQFLYALPQNQNIDAINLFLNQKEDTLYFTNKNDYILWGLKVKDLIPKI